MAISTAMKLFLCGFNTLRLFKVAPSLAYGYPGYPNNQQGPPPLYPPTSLSGEPVMQQQHLQTMVQNQQQQSSPSQPEQRNDGRQQPTPPTNGEPQQPVRPGSNSDSPRGMLHGVSVSHSSPLTHVSTTEPNQSSASEMPQSYPSGSQQQL